jgi:uncharacterized repeat protein (TIGR04052 family)
MRWIAAAALVLLAGCKPADQAVTIQFQPVIHQTAVSCSAGAEGLALTDLRFFVHDVALIDAAGRATPVVIDVAPPWQNHDVALVDLEDGKQACDTGSPATHMALSGHAPAGHYVGLRFTLGVPFRLNHADPDEAEPPLDQTAMHWHWQAGYKFLRAGVRKGDATVYLHLGSTGCEGHIGAISGCKRANRPTVELAHFDPARDTVAVDIGTLFSELPGGVQACQSEPDNADCAPMMRHLGLAGDPQDVFRALAR